MDKNSAIGLTLIALLLLVYFYWFAPTSRSVAPTRQSVPSLAETRPDTLTSTPPTVIDSAMVAQFGDLGSALQGTESTTHIQTEDLNITFTNRGAQVKSWIAKKFQDDNGQPLELVNKLAADKFGYPMALCLMAATSLTLYRVFKHRGWL